MNTMFLVAVDGSDHGWKALDLAASLARASDAEVVILHVVPYEPTPEAFRNFARSEGIRTEELSARYHYARRIGDRIIEEAETIARKDGLTKVTTRVAEGNPVNEIVALAKSENASMIFLGSRGLSDVKGLLLGSVSHKVMQLAPCTCVAVR